MFGNYRTRRAARNTARRAVRMAGRGAAAAYGVYRKMRGATNRIRRAKKNTPGKYKSSLERKIIPRVGRVNDFAAATGNELTVTKRVVGRYPKLTVPRLFNLMKASMNECVLRYQGITNFDTNVGWHALANRQDVAGALPSAITSPVHIYDLTSFPNTTTTPRAAGYHFYWSGGGTGAALNKAILRGQDATGGTDATGAWQFEKVGSGDFRAPYANNILHDWVDIRLNLLGSRKRGTTYTVQLVQFRDEFTNPVYGSLNNRQVVDWMRTQERPLIYSNLQSYNVASLKKKIRVIKTYKVYVPGGSADDLDTIGKVKELRIFHRIGKVMNMKWESEAGTGDSIAHLQEDGLDFTSASGPQDYPQYSNQLFLVIKAFSPERRIVGAIWGPETAADPLTEPSYDVLIRNKFTTPL